MNRLIKKLQEAQPVIDRMICEWVHRWFYWMDVTFDRNRGRAWQCQRCFRLTTRTYDSK